MIVLGIDPGATTGYVVYDTEAKTVTARGRFRGHDSVMMLANGSRPTIATVERLVPHGASYPQVVEGAYTAGRLTEWAGAQMDAVELTRAEVRGILQDATHGAIKVKDDKTAWAALLLLHGGEEAGKRGGCLFEVKSHERAALAVAVAWAIREGVAC